MACWLNETAGTDCDRNKTVTTRSWQGYPEAPQHEVVAILLGNVVFTRRDICSFLD